MGYEIRIKPGKLRNFVAPPRSAAEDWLTKSTTTATGATYSVLTTTPILSPAAHWGSHEVPGSSDDLHRPIVSPGSSLGRRHTGLELCVWLYRIVIGQSARTLKKLFCPRTGDLVNSNRTR